MQGRDDGTLVHDNVILLSEIFDDINESIKLMPDTGLILLNNGNDFIELSNGKVELNNKQFNLNNLQI